MWWFWRFPILLDDLDGSLVVVAFCCFEKVEYMLSWFDFSGVRSFGWL